jgi:TRAP-type transport system large permease protein
VLLTRKARAFLAAAVAALDRVASLVVISAMAVLTVVVFLQVVMRYGFNSSLDWGWEVPRLCFIGTIFLALPLGLKSGAHVAINFLLSRVGEHGRVALVVLQTALSILLMGIVAVYGAWLTLDLRPPDFLGSACDPAPAQRRADRDPAAAHRVITVIIVAFFVFAVLGLPLAFALGLAAVSGMLFAGFDLAQLPGKMLHSVDSFPLMAIPLFMVAGQLMIRGGIMEPLIDLANAVVGRVRGGLAHVTIVSAMAVSSVSGVAVADAAALGGSIGPHLAKAYSKTFAAALVAAASCMGPIIPPSAAMIVYAVVASDVSVAGLFMAGIVPGIVIGIGMMLMCGVIAGRRDYPISGDRFSFGRVLVALRKAFLILLMPVVVIGGIIGGVFTATEGAAAAVFYGLVVGFFVTRKLTVADLAPALLNAGIITAVVGALIAFSSVVTYLFTLNRVGDVLASSLLSISRDPTVFIFLMMAALLVLGMFMEGNAIIIMLAPIAAPIAATLQIDPVYFGFLFVMNVVLGSITPPVGILLFVVSSIWRVGMAALAREVFPFIVLLYGILALCVFFPDIVIGLPRLMGYAK